MFLIIALKVTDYYNTIFLFDVIGSSKTFIVLLFIYVLHLISKLRENIADTPHRKNYKGLYAKMPTICE